MPALIDLTNEIFGQWTVIERAKNKGSSAAWLCLCSCGNKKIVSRNNLKSGDSQSCGCLRNERIKQARGGNSHYKHPLYNTWGMIKQRCYNKKQTNYPYYGGRGIKMSKSWYNSFEQFVKDVGERPSNKHTIERKNNNKEYNKSNCRWATRKEQANNRRSNIMRTYKGETFSLTVWAEKLNVRYIAV